MFGLLVLVCLLGYVQAGLPVAPVRLGIPDSLICKAGGHSGPPPAPTSFSALIMLKISAGLSGLPLAPSKGHFLPGAYDANVGASFGLETNFLGGHAVAYDITQLRGRQLLRQNGQCHILAEEFRPWFSWLPAAKWVGNATIDGVPTSQWALVTQNTTLTYYESQGLPKCFNITRFVSGGAVSHTAFVFRQVSVGPVALNTTCPPPFFCPPSKPEVQMLPMVRLHSNFSYSLMDENTGDVRGDVFWMCLQLQMRQDMGNMIVSQFLVSVNTTFGQYQYCNLRQCVGNPSQPPNVGRESFAGLESHLSGQCDGNPVLGTWYSLTTKANAAGQWSLKQRVRSVSMQCLVKMGLGTLCSPEQYPFDDAVVLVTKALNGLCPDVPPPRA